MRANKYREAEVVLAREQQKDLLDFQVRNQLVTVYMELAKQALEHRNLVEADEMIRAGNAVQLNMRAIAIRKEALLPNDFPDILIAREGEISLVQGRLRSSAETGCYMALGEAATLHGQAKHLVGKNERDKVIQGLEYVRKCHESQKWLGANAKGKANKLMDDLLSLVTINERDSILAAAGFSVAEKSQ